MDIYQFIASLAGSLAWPLFILIVVLVLRRPIIELLGRVSEAEALGGKVKFDPKKAEPSVALATAEATASAPAGTVAYAGVASGVGRALDATVRVRESLASTLAELAIRHPSAAVVAAYAEVEKILRAKFAEADVNGSDRLSGAKLVQLATKEGVISPQTGDALRGVLELRNLAAHGREGVDAAKALDYLLLADGVIYAIETWRRG